MKARIMEMTGDEFEQLRLSRSDEFSRKTLDTIRAAIESIAVGDVLRLEALLRDHPSLVEASGFDDTAEELSYFHGATLLHYVAGNPTDNPISGHVCDITRVLLRAGADPNAQTSVGHNTPLCLVASGSQAREAGVQKELLEILIEAGADVDGLAVYAALIHGETEGASTLHEHGARLDLRFAAGLGNIEEMRRFFTDGGRLRPDARISHRRRPYYEREALEDELPEMTHDEILIEALAFAVMNRQLEAAQFLVNCVADINGMPARLHGGGHTSLHFVCTSLARATPEIVAFLLDNGADPTRRDETGVGATPPQWAVHNGLPTCVAVFVEYAVIEGDTHLRQAVTQLLESIPQRREKRLAVVKIMLEANADPTRSADDGWTAVEAARTSGDKELVGLIKQYLR